MILQPCVAAIGNYQGRGKEPETARQFVGVSSPQVKSVVGRWSPGLLQVYRYLTVMPLSGGWAERSIDPILDEIREGGEREGGFDNWICDI
jgi:hypothetical protein